jgi:hypothetical protein
MRPRPSGLGGVETEMVLATSGKTGAVTLYSSVLMEDTGEGEHGVYFGKTVVVVPTESIVVEMLIPSGWTDPGTARVAVYARRDLPEHVYELRPADLLPQRETFDYLGATHRPPAVEGAPRHAEAVRHVLAGLGWDRTLFDVYRCRVRYPVLHSMLFYGVDAVR